MLASRGGRWVGGNTPGLDPTESAHVSRAEAESCSGPLHSEHENSTTASSLQGGTHVQRGSVCPSPSSFEALLFLNYFSV